EAFAAALPEAAGPAPVDPAVKDSSPVQILFTSGTTAEPKGVVHTHRNVLASVAPIEREIEKYRKYEKWVHPLRFLHTLPLSHVFGQFMGLWIPPVLAAVPRVVGLLRDLLVADDPELPVEIEKARGLKAWKRWWRFRKIHRRF